VLVLLPRRFHLSGDRHRALPYFVDRSRRLIQERGLDGRVRVESVGLKQITFDPEFDLITMVQVFHEVPDAPRPTFCAVASEAYNPPVCSAVDRCSPELGPTCVTAVSP